MAASFTVNSGVSSQNVVNRRSAIVASSNPTFDNQSTDITIMSCINSSLITSQQCSMSSSDGAAMSLTSTSLISASTNASTIQNCTAASVISCSASGVLNSTYCLVGASQQCIFQNNSFSSAALASNLASSDVSHTAFIATNQPIFTNTTGAYNALMACFTGCSTPVGSYDTILSSQQSSIRGGFSSIIACDTCEVATSSSHSFITASTSCNVGDNVVIGQRNSIISGLFSFVDNLGTGGSDTSAIIASRNSTINDCVDCFIGGSIFASMREKERTCILASPTAFSANSNVNLPRDCILMGNVANFANITLQTVPGIITTVGAGAIGGGAVACGFAEWMDAEGDIDPGYFVSVNGAGNVVKATSEAGIIGVSKHPKSVGLILGCNKNETPVMFKNGRFGECMEKSVEKTIKGKQIMVLEPERTIEFEKWITDSKTFTPTTSVLVEFIGITYLRVSDAVNVGDFVTCSVSGTGEKKLLGTTRFRCIGFSDTTPGSKIAKILIS